MKEILYCKNKTAFGYKKISAIKDVGYGWGSGELEKEAFGILKVNISADKIEGWQNRNLYCVNDEGTAVIETPEEYVYAEIIESLGYNPLEMQKEVNS